MTSQRRQAGFAASMMKSGLHTYLLFHLLTCFGENALGSEIINGEKVPANSMPYMVSVQTNNRHLCGGFLVNEEFVVTAAHCDKDTPITVFLGTHNLKKVGKKMRYNVEKWKNPHYKNPSEGADIMLLKLSEKARLNKRVQPIQLPWDGHKIKDEGECQVAGWGLTRDLPKNVGELQMVNVSMIDKRVCEREWRKIEVKLPDSVICAGGYNTKKGFCTGDSGGPLVCSGMAVGVVSFNRDNSCNYPDAPNVYTDVAKYLPWIKGIIRQKDY